MKSNIITLGADFGADPEVHLFDREEGRVVSSLRIIKRDKRKPVSLGDGIRYYADNVLTEFAFPPASSIEGVIGRIGDVMGRVQEDLGPRFQLYPKAAHLYDKVELRSKRCWEVGCNPSKNAYLEKDNPIIPFTDGLRTGSFHLHVGHHKAEGHDLRPKVEIVKLLDIFVGCASVRFDKDETAPLRRAYYGKAGEFRSCPYGAEYRVLGNWALRQPKTTRLVWDLAAHAIAHFDGGDAKELIEAVGSSRVQSAINNNNKQLAKEVLEVAALPTSLMQRVEMDYGMVPFHQAWEI